MTHILYILNANRQWTRSAWSDQPADEVAAGFMNIGLAASRRSARARRWAVPQLPLDVVTVTLGQPPVGLSPQQVRLLYGVYAGLNAAAAGRRMAVTARTARMHAGELRLRFGSYTLDEVIAKSVKLGLLPR